MSTTNPLVEAFNQTAYPVIGHGKRNVSVLIEALEQIDPELDSDNYGSGEVIERFQAQIAQYLGKPSAVFFPSGTMAQQIALRIWCDRKGLKKVAYHPLSHLEIHEEQGLQELHQIESILLADKTRIIRLEDVVNLKEDVACVLLELPQREIGGQLPEYEELEAISSYCREKGIKLHLDGARLYETLPYYQKTAEEICSLFDSVYVSFYKGIGGIAGAMLAGDEEFTKESKVWKRRHGGDLISLYPYILSAEYYFNERKDKMGLYYEAAKELADFYRACRALEVRPQVPVSNMFHVHVPLPKSKLEPILISVYQDTEVGLTANLKENGEHACYYEVSLGDRYAKIPKAKLAQAMKLLDERTADVL
ncbi:threonine aldolase family protein [Paenibacillus cremeus]|uniref:Low specificity L-threonine aldolase n=1 Tax=Paenibacillus cremeus TaxID=2163881 RepID=A0A559K6U7_9BACL|nr:beta-eliminating lyase-related protein [Paenibacillus cremeus]TVY07844.1 low specificity L-threonine aldolase [Paenibacillus cremeus]